MQERHSPQNRHHHIASKQNTYDFSPTPGTSQHKHLSKNGSQLPTLHEQQMPRLIDPDQCGQQHLAIQVDIISPSVNQGSIETAITVVSTGLYHVTRPQATSASLVDAWLRTRGLLNDTRTLNRKGEKKGDTLTHHPDH